jgi:hypothetical protein
MLQTSKRKRVYTFNINVEQLNPSQYTYFKGKDPFLLMSAGFGTGKTTVGAFKIVQLACVNRYVPGLIVAQSWTALKSTILRKLRQVTGLPLPVMDPMGERYITLDGFTPIYLRTAHNPGLMDGLDVGWVYADEIRHYKKAAYDIMIARRRVPCSLPQNAFTSTPTIGWMSDEFDSDLPNRHVIHASTHENIKNLAPGYISDLEAAWSKRLRQAVIYGQFVVLEGAVFDAFDKKNGPWYIDYTPVPERKTRLWIDPGYRRSSVIWCQEVSKFKWCCIDQLHLDDRSMEYVVGVINDMNKNRDYHIDEIWCDPAADAKDQATEINVMQVLRDIKCRNKYTKNIRYTTGLYSGISWGVERTRVLLGNPEEEREPMLYFNRHMVAREKASNGRGVIKSLSALSYPTKEGKPVVDEPEKDGVHDHATDALRYGAVGLYLTTGLRQHLAAMKVKKEAAIKHVVSK